MAAFRRKAAQLQIQLRGKPRILTGFLLIPPPRSAAAKGTMIRCMLFYVQNTTPGSNCQYLFPSLPLFRDVHPKNPHREEPPPAASAGGGVGAGVSPHPVRKEIKNEEAVNFMWGGAIHAHLLLPRSLLDDFRHKPLQDRSCLGALRVGRRLQLVMVVAVQQLGGNRPLHVARGPCADG